VSGPVSGPALFPGEIAGYGPSTQSLSLLTSQTKLLNISTAAGLTQLVECQLPNFTAPRNIIHKTS